MDGAGAGRQFPGPPDAGAGTARAHVEEAIRHLRLAIDTGSCGVCADLWREEVQHLEATEALATQAEAIVRAQAEKRKQLGTPGPAAVGRPSRDGTGPGGVARSWWRDRPRLSDLISGAVPRR